MEKKTIKRIVIEKGGNSYEIALGGAVGADSVGSDEIMDGSVQMNDLNESVREKIQKTYDQQDETLYMDFEAMGGTNPSGNGGTVTDLDGPVDDEF